MTARGYWDTTIDTPDSLDLLEGSTLDDRPTADMRRGAAWRAALVRLDIQDGQRFGDHERRLRYHRFTNSGASTWMLNRASGVALVPCDPDERSVHDSYVAGTHHLELMAECDRRAIARRELMTRDVCRLVASTMMDTAYMLAERAHAKSSRPHRDEATADSFPGYCMLRNWLAYECDAPYLLACAIAFEFAALNAGLERRRANHRWPAWEAARNETHERGWM